MVAWLLAAVRVVPLIGAILKCLYVCAGCVVVVVVVFVDPSVVLLHSDCVRDLIAVRCIFCISILVL